MSGLPIQHRRGRVLKTGGHSLHENKRFGDTFQTKFSHRSTRINHNTMFPTRPLFYQSIVNHATDKT
jgi:hypothetical protein